MWCDVMWYDAIWCDMMWYDMMWYDVIWYDMIWYDMIWYDMIWYDMIWYDTTQHNTTQHNTTQHNTTWHNTTQHLVIISRAALASHALHRDVITLIFSIVYLSALSMKQGGKYLPWGNSTCPNHIKNIEWNLTVSRLLYIQFEWYMGQKMDMHMQING